MEQLEKGYEKEMRLAKQHEKKAADYKKQIEQFQVNNAVQKIVSFKMNSEEFDILMKLFKSGKKSVLEAANLVLGKKAEEVKADANGEEKAPD